MSQRMKLLHSDKVREIAVTQWEGERDTQVGRWWVRENVTQWQGERDTQVGRWWVREWSCYTVTRWERYSGRQVMSQRMKLLHSELLQGERDTQVGREWVREWSCYTVRRWERYSGRQVMSQRMKLLHSDSGKVREIAVTQWEGRQVMSQRMKLLHSDKVREILR